MTSAGTVSITQEEGDKFFEEHADIGVKVFTLVLFLVFGGGLTFVVAFFAVIVSGWSVVTLPAGLLAIALLLFALLLAVNVTKAARDLAVKQCVAVSEKVGCRLNRAHFIELILEGYAEGVFETFVGMLEDMAQGAIPEGFFAGAGDRNNKSCRHLVEYLWKS